LSKKELKIHCPEKARLRIQKPKSQFPNLTDQMFDKPYPFYSEEKLLNPKWRQQTPSLNKPKYEKSS